MYYFILNPSSRSGSGAGTWARTRQILHQRGIPFEVRATKYKGHASELARQITEGDPEATVVVVGGDGSIHEVLNGLTHLDSVKFGVIPQGSGNDFAAGMGISRDPSVALEAILQARRIRRMDIGLVKQDGRQLRFGVSAGIGFDAAVCHEALSSPIKDTLNALGAGKLAYSAIAARQILLYDTGTMRLRLDGERTFTFPRAYFAAIMNQPFEGGGVMMTPEARSDDGVLDVLVCADLFKAELVAALPLARYGLHTRHRGLHFLKCSSVEIRTEEKRPIHLDGESGGISSSLRVTIDRQRLQVIC